METAIPIRPRRTTNLKDTKMIAETSPQSKLAMPLDELVAMATAIVKETVRVHANAKAAIEPYTHTVKKLVSAQLTYSERKAAGLLSQDEVDAIECVLRASAVKRERNHERRNAQTSRVGWRPRKTSKRRLAQDIVHSIKSNEGRSIRDYTADPELVELVQSALA